MWVPVHAHVAPEAGAGDECAAATFQLLLWFAAAARGIDDDDDDDDASEAALCVQRTVLVRFASLGRHAGEPQLDTRLPTRIVRGGVLVADGVYRHAVQLRSENGGCAWYALPYVSADWVAARASDGGDARAECSSAAAAAAAAETAVELAEAATELAAIDGDGACDERARVVSVSGIGRAASAPTAERIFTLLDVSSSSSSSAAAPPAYRLRIDRRARVRDGNDAARDDGQRRRHRRHGAAHSTLPAARLLEVAGKLERRLRSGIEEVRQAEMVRWDKRMVLANACGQLASVARRMEAAAAAAGDEGVGVSDGDGDEDSDGVMGDLWQLTSGHDDNAEDEGTRCGRASAACAESDARPSTSAAAISLSGARHAIDVERGVWRLALAVPAESGREQSRCEDTAASLSPSSSSSPPPPPARTLMVSSPTSVIDGTCTRRRRRRARQLKRKHADERSCSPSLPSAADENTEWVDEYTFIAPLHQVICRTLSIAIAEQRHGVPTRDEDEDSRRRRPRPRQRCRSGEDYGNDGNAVRVLGAIHVEPAAMPPHDAPLAAAASLPAARTRRRRLLEMFIDMPRGAGNSADNLVAWWQRARRSSIERARSSDARACRMDLRASRVLPATAHIQIHAIVGGDAADADADDDDDAVQAANVHARAEYVALQLRQSLPDGARVVALGPVREFIRRMAVLRRVYDRWYAERARDGGGDDNDDDEDAERVEYWRARLDHRLADAHELMWQFSFDYGDGDGENTVTDA